MNNRHITILGIIQVMVLGIGILLTRAFCKIGYADWMREYPMPSGLRTALNFRNYGLFWGILMIAWVIWAVRAEAGHSFKHLPNRFVFISGLGIAIFFLVYSAYCCREALSALCQL